MYDSQKGPSTGQKGPKYPNLSKDSNPLQTVRDLGRMPQEDSYKMQPGRFMPPVGNTAVDTSGNRAIVRDGRIDGLVAPKREIYNSDQNLHQRFVSDSIEPTDGRK